MNLIDRTYNKLHDELFDSLISRSIWYRSSNLKSFNELLSKSNNQINFEKYSNVTNKSIQLVTTDPTRSLVLKANHVTIIHVIHTKTKTWTFRYTFTNLNELTRFIVKFNDKSLTF